MDHLPCPGVLLVALPVALRVALRAVWRVERAVDADREVDEAHAGVQDEVAQVGVVRDEEAQEEACPEDSCQLNPR